MDSHPDPPASPTAPPAPMPSTVLPPPPPPTTPGPLVFAFDERATVLQCDTITGRGDGRRYDHVVIFVRYETDSVWFYEQPVVFSADRTWTSQNVQTGGPDDGGKTFIYAAVDVSGDTAAFLKTKDGTTYSVQSLPGAKLTQTRPIVRTSGMGTC